MAVGGQWAPSFRTTNRHNKRAPYWHLLVFCLVSLCVAGGGAAPTGAAADTQEELCSLVSDTELVTLCSRSFDKAQKVLMLNCETSKRQQTPPSACLGRDQICTLDITIANRIANSPVPFNDLICDDGLVTKLTIEGLESGEDAFGNAFPASLTIDLHLVHFQNTSLGPKSLQKLTNKMAKIRSLMITDWQQSDSNLQEGFLPRKGSLGSAKFEGVTLNQIDPSAFDLNLQFQKLTLKNLAVNRISSKSITKEVCDGKPALDVQISDSKSLKAEAFDPMFLSLEKCALTNFVLSLNLRLTNLDFGRLLPKTIVRDTLLRNMLNSTDKKNKVMVEYWSDPVDCCDAENSWLFTELTDSNNMGATDAPVKINFNVSCSDLDGANSVGSLLAEGANWQRACSMSKENKMTTSVVIIVGIIAIGLVVVAVFLIWWFLTGPPSKQNIIVLSPKASQWSPASPSKPESSQPSRSPSPLPPQPATKSTQPSEASKTSKTSKATRHGSDRTAITDLAANLNQQPILEIGEDTNGTQNGDSPAEQPAAKMPSDERPALGEQTTRTSQLLKAGDSAATAKTDHAPTTPRSPLIGGSASDPQLAGRPSSKLMAKKTPSALSKQPGSSQIRKRPSDLRAKPKKPLSDPMKQKLSHPRAVNLPKTKFKLPKLMLRKSPRPEHKHNRPKRDSRGSAERKQSS